MVVSTQDDHTVYEKKNLNEVYEFFIFERYHTDVKQKLPTLDRFKSFSEQRLACCIFDLISNNAQKKREGVLIFCEEVTVL